MQTLKGGNLKMAERITLGKKLRQITEDAAATNAEAQALYDAMKTVAMQGQNSIHFDDLRSIVPNMILRETLKPWLEAEEIQMNGMVDPNTAAWSYTLSW